jgi:transcriptional regulator with XRE-family HTH domain
MNAEKWFQDELETVRKTFEYRLEKILIQLGEDICRLMQDQQISRADVAERLGVSRAYVTRVLNGNPNLTIKTLLKLSDALGRELAISFAPKPDASAARHPRRALSHATPSR